MPRASLPDSASSLGWSLCPLASPCESVSDFVYGSVSLSLLISSAVFRAQTCSCSLLTRVLPPPPHQQVCQLGDSQPPCSSGRLAQGQS